MVEVFCYDFGSLTNIYFRGDILMSIDGSPLRCCNCVNGLYEDGERCVCKCHYSKSFVHNNSWRYKI